MHLSGEGESKECCLVESEERGWGVLLKTRHFFKEFSKVDKPEGVYDNSGKALREKYRSNPVPVKKKWKTRRGLKKFWRTQNAKAV